VLALTKSTAENITDAGYKKAFAQIEIAKVQAVGGDLQEALETVKLIQDLYEQTLALTDILRVLGGFSVIKGAGPAFCITLDFSTEVFALGCSFNLIMKECLMLSLLLFKVMQNAGPAP
jgi:hypothetical protein